MRRNPETESALGKRALVISVADCGFYLAGYTEEPEGHSDTLALIRGADNRPKKFASLSQAKHWFVQQGEERAWLVMQTPYDEMIGKESVSSSELPLILSEQEDPA